MPIIASVSGGTDFPICPSGVHDAVCAFVVDVGHEHSEIYDKWAHKAQVCWEINVPMSDGKPFMLSKRYTVSLGEKANLRKDLEGWRGAKFKEDELKGFDLERLVGKQCQIQVIHNEKGGKTYANVQAVLPKGKNSPNILVVNTVIPEWICKLADDNAAKYAQHLAEIEPVVVMGLDDAEKAKIKAIDESTPF